MSVYVKQQEKREQERLVVVGGGGSDEVTQSVAHAWSYRMRYVDKGARAASQMGVRVEVGGHNW